MRKLHPKLTACAVAAVLAFMPLCGAYAVYAVAEEMPAETSDLSGLLTTEDDLLPGTGEGGESGTGETLSTETGQEEGGSGTGTEGGTPGSGTEASDQAGTGGGEEGLPGNGEDNGNPSEGSDPADTGDSSQPEGQGSAVEAGSTDTGLPENPQPGTGDTAVTDQGGQEISALPETGKTDLPDAEDSSIEEDATEEASEPEEEEQEEDLPGEEEELPEEEEEEEDNSFSARLQEDLTPEQEEVLADEDAAQAEQAFDYFESYSPWLFAYQNYWRGWKQGESAWYSMRNYGCRMTAYSKLLRASGVVSPGNFSPDTFFLWCRNNGYLLGTIREIGTPGDCMISYAAEKGYTITRMEGVSLFKSADPEARKQEIIDKINEGYYVILCSSAHFVYVDELRTRITQELWVDDSINGENIYKVDRYVFQGSLADWENADPRKNWHYRYFKVEETEGFEGQDAPSVLYANVSSYDEEAGVYTVSAVVDAPNSMVDRVMFPTWSDNDEHSDLPSDWEYGTGFAGYPDPEVAGMDRSVYCFKVKLAEHGDVTGKYYTYVYAYDKDGNRSAPFTLTVTVE